tara:strand:+ start:100 stop:432 length:333 start_codon:yes stop_codon:yes gene_type:complete
MKINLIKTILIVLLSTTFVFAGGVEEDPGPEVISESEKISIEESQDYDTELTTREDIDEYQEIVSSLDENNTSACDGEGNVVKWSGGCVTWSGGYIEEDEQADTFVRYSK